jgi:hypothetical protein
MHYIAKTAITRFVPYFGSGSGTGFDGRLYLDPDPGGLKRAKIKGDKEKTGQKTDK